LLVINGVAFTDEVKLVRKATGYGKKRSPPSGSGSPAAWADPPRPFDRISDPQIRLTRQISKATCRILVLGYYPILSPMSDPLGVTKLVSLFGIAKPPFLKKEEEKEHFINPVIWPCEAFFADSTR
jgi:hypothetical protein